MSSEEICYTYMVDRAWTPCLAAPELKARTTFARNIVRVPVLCSYWKSIVLRDTIVIRIHHAH